MPPIWIFVALALSGVALVVTGLVGLRAVGARPTVARRLAGPPEVRVGRLADAGDRTGRPVRVSGRIRCRDPLDAGNGERLVAYHRDVEARIGGRWRSIERLRETRSFELWDHDGSLTIDPALAAEPLVAIPKVWRGDPAELEEPHASAVSRLAERLGPATGARATTRTINLTDRLLILGQPVAADDGRARLEPPKGGFVITNLALGEAMRLLGGRHRRVTAASIVGTGLGVALAAIGAGGMLAAVLLGG
jgi:hypothetical protein